MFFAHLIVPLQAEIERIVFVFMAQTPQDKTSAEVERISREELMKAQSNTPIEDDGCPWYALRLFTLRQMDVVNALVEKGMEFFGIAHSTK